jgi:hypothetical protein
MIGGAAIVASSFTLAMPAHAATVRKPSSVLPGHYNCSQSSSSRWVKQMWPNMAPAHPRSGYFEYVKFRAKLQRWEHNKWVTKRTSAWYRGRSGIEGRIEWPAGMYGWPVYFTTMAGNTPSPQEGILFRNVSKGYYRTVETYHWNANHVTKSKVSSTGPRARSAKGAPYCYVR